MVNFVPRWIVRIPGSDCVVGLAWSHRFDWYPRVDHLQDGKRQAFARDWASSVLVYPSRWQSRPSPCHTLFGLRGLCQTLCGLQDLVQTLYGLQGLVHILYLLRGRVRRRSHCRHDRKTSQTVCLLRAQTVPKSYPR
jgi:hypothetical protein